MGLNLRYYDTRPPGDPDAQGVRQAAKELRSMRKFLFIGVLALPVFGQFNSYRYTAGQKFANFPDFEPPLQPQPEKSGCVQDAFWFNNTVCRLTDVLAQWNPINPAVYMEKIPVARWTTENADASLFYTQIAGDVPAKLGKGQIAIYRTSDNSLYAHPKLSAYEGQEFRWSDTDPKLMYYVPLGTCQFASYDVDSQQTKIIRDFRADFPGCATIRNDTEGTSSVGSRYWAWMVQGDARFGNTKLLAMIVYDLKTDAIIGKLDEAKFVEQGGTSFRWNTYGLTGRPNSVDIAPSNDRVFALWPAVPYPSGENFVVNAAPSTVVKGKLQIYSLTPFESVFAVGDQVQLRYANGSATGGPGCSGAAANLTDRYPIESFPDPYTAVIDVSAAGLADGKYTCSYLNPAVVSVSVRGGLGTMVLGSKHFLVAGRLFWIFNTPEAQINGKTLTVDSVVDERTVTFTTTAADGVYNAAMMYYRDPKKGSAIPDTDTSYPDFRPKDAGNDGAHVYNLDFSHPVRVSSGQPHTGWAWDLNGDPVLLQQISQANWSGAQVDTFGFTNIYTGVYTPLFFQEDFNWEPTAMHESRFYDRSIRGWGLFKLANNSSAKSPIRNQVILVELKHYSQHPEIWRVGYLHNDYGCATLAADQRYKINGCNPAKPYDTEAQLSLSRDGLSYYWSGLWPNGAASIDVYRANIPLRVKTKGSFVASQITGTTASISYLAPTPDSTCKVTTSPRSDYTQPVESELPSAGTAQQRSFVVGQTTALTPATRYYVKVSCSWTPTDPAAVSSEEVLGTFMTDAKANPGQNRAR